MEKTCYFPGWKTRTDTFGNELFSLTCVWVKAEIYLLLNHFFETWIPPVIVVMGEAQFCWSYSTEREPVSAPLKQFSTLELYRGEIIEKWECCVGFWEVGCCVNGASAADLPLKQGRKKNLSISRWKIKVQLPCQWSSRGKCKSRIYEQQSFIIHPFWAEPMLMTLLGWLRVIAQIMSQSNQFINQVIVWKPSWTDTVWFIVVALSRNAPSVPDI